MKKTLLVVAVATMLVFAFSASAFAYGPFNFPFNNNGTASSATPSVVTKYYGYASWAYIQGVSTADTSTPHGNYTTSTSKCSVCHSVHKASVGGKVLTAWPGAGAPAGNDNFNYMSCTWCHGSSAPLFATSQITMGTTLSPHGYCGRCHSKSVHGADGSVYPVLKARMINTRADSDIGIEIGAGSNNIAAVDFQNASDTGAMALGTGYLCGSTGCHTGGVTFPVNAPGAAPIKGGVASAVTGHRVLAMNTTNWNNDQSYGVVYSAGQNTTPFGGPVAFAPVGTCYACHDAKGTGNVKAFPHNYVNAAGAAQAKDVLGSSYVWLTTAGQVSDPRVVAGKTQTGTTNEIAGQLDGLCLKCHRSSSLGVGINY